MSHWDYENVGASALPENRKYVQKIFEYIGYASEPEYIQDDPKCRFRDPDVYCCKYSASEASGSISNIFRDMDEEDSSQIHQHVLFAHLKVDTHLRNPFCGLMAYPLAFLGSVPSLTLCLNDTKSCVPLLGLIIFGNK